MTANKSTLSPLDSVLQTVAAGAWTFVFIFGGMLGLICLGLLFFTPYYPVVFLYLGWMFWDRHTCETGGRRSEWVRNWTWWRLNRDYFPVRLVKTVPLPPSSNYLFAVYPHGILSTGPNCNFSSNAPEFGSLFPGLSPSLLTVNYNFWMPLFRELLLAKGFLSVSERSIAHTLNKSKGGRVLCIMVGGLRECSKCRPGRYEIILKPRKGFVRLAIKTGTPLVPVFTFGETDLYDQASSPRLIWIQKLVRQLTGINLCIPIGRGLFLMPRRHELTTVVGAPIHVPKDSEPSQDLIEEYHKKYMDCLTRLFEEHKHKYVDNAETTKLVIV
uniref:Acyltransferase n=1 Tax=Cacopsylla melanoneura TaxID=428564 RepID=A0A8D8YAP9_9HEMI